MSLSKQDKKKGSPKESTTDSTSIEQSVNPEAVAFQKRVDAMMAGFVGTLNKNTAKKRTPGS